MSSRAAVLALLALQSIACSSSSSSEASRDAGAVDARSADGGGDDAAPLPCDGGACIPHLIVIVQENQTFDNHFGAYCTAAGRSNPSCNTGPACCEAMPATDPAGTVPTVITDAVHAAYDPNHAQEC